MGLGRKKACGETLPFTYTTGIATGLNAPGPGLVLFKMSLVLPDTSQLMTKLYVVDPGGPKKASTASRDLPEATKSRSDSPSVFEIVNRSPTSPSRRVMRPLLSKRSS